MEQTVVVENRLARNGFHCSLLQPHQFDHYWASIEGMMDRVPHTWQDITKSEVIARVHGDSLQVWGVNDDEAIVMVLFTQIAVYSTGRVLQVIWGAGQGSIFEIAGDAVDASFEWFAKTRECHRIDVIGRGGWEKVLRDRGFTRSAVVLSRPVIHRGLQ